MAAPIWKLPRLAIITRIPPYLKLKSGGPAEHKTGCGGAPGGERAAHSWLSRAEGAKERRRQVEREFLLAERRVNWGLESGHE